VRVLVALLFALWSAVAVAAAPASLDGEVSRVVIRGTRWIDEATVRDRLGIQEGFSVTADQIRRDLEGIYDTGFFEDVVVKVDRDDKGLIVIFEVKEKPAVLDIRIEGNKKIDEEDLRELIDVKSFGVLNESKLKNSVELMRDKYVEKGFYLASIEPVVIPVGEDQVEVVFQIVENRKVIVQRIEFTGNDNVIDSKIKRYMQTKEGGFAPWLTSTGNFDQDLLDTDREIIRFVFMEEGYVDAKVDPPKVYLSPDKRYIYISFQIEEGQQYSVGDLSVTGDFVEDEGLTEDAALDIIAGRLVQDVQEEQWRLSRGKSVPERLDRIRATKLVSGETLRWSSVQAVAENVARLYKDQGYAFANVTPMPEPDPETGLVHLGFQVQRGDKMRIGRVFISGNDPTFDKVVRREVLVNEGEIYRGTLLEATKLRLMRLGFFEDVAIETPKAPGKDRTLDLRVKVTEQPTGSFSLGLGYSNLERLAVNGNISKNNFLGLGWNVALAVNWSRLRRQASLSFFDPYFADSRWTFKLDGYWIERRIQLDEFQRGATIGIGRYLDRRDDIQLRLEYTIENVGISSLDAYRQRLYGGALFRNGVTSSVGLSFVADRRNNRIFPTKGFFATASVALAGGFRTGDGNVVSLLGGDFNFVEAKLNFRFYQPLIPNSDWLVFRFNSSLGAVWSTDGRIIPFIHRYRAGGINSVRGFQWFSLGPTIRTIRSDDPTAGDDILVIGGTQSWVNNIEIESPIVRAAGISAVVFFDAGNAFGDPLGNGTINPIQLRTAAGLGIRWRSPIGPLRFELGFPLQPREDERRSVFDFSIGSFF
jgi:outer membrane protein insertion porin family